MITKKDNYNNVPVSYCKTCLSLAIKDVSLSSENPHQNTIGYCTSCSNVDLGVAHIDEWEALYEDKYKKKFL